MNDTPVYFPLVNRIKDDISAGRFLPGQMIGTEVGLAVESGISRSSVRLAINDLARAGMVERRPGRGVFACRPVAGTRVVEIVLCDLDGVWTDLANGAQDAGVRQGVKAHIYNANRDFEADMRAIQLLPSSGVAGAIIGALHRSRMNRALVQLWQTGFPFVLCDQRMQDVDVPSVVFDNYQAGYLAAQELIRLGHRRIAFVGYSVPGLSGCRLDGFRDALNDAGIVFDRSLAVIQPVDADAPAQKPSFEEFLVAMCARTDRPSAIVFHSEDLATAGCRLLKSQGLRMPDDISVVGIGRERPCGLCDPPLATVDLPFREMGAIAMEMLLQKLDNPEGPVDHRILQIKWIARESVRTNSRGPRG
jgi:DNA-binding LacI/PurR family transcriptional regulator